VNLDVLTIGPTEILVDFSKDVLHDGSADAADNLDNYLLFQPGLNGIFDTADCAAEAAKSTGDDIFLTVGPVTYTNNGGGGPYRATVGINGGEPLDIGSYQFHVCGTTSVEDFAGNTLNDGSDMVINFRIRAESLPATGFAPGVASVGNTQPSGGAYTSLGGLWLEIPQLGIGSEIIGIPPVGAGWDLSWLGDNIGWLSGTAFPTWDGNTVLTAHTYNANGMPGPFLGLESLGWGDQIHINAFGQRFTYEVRSVSFVYPDNTSHIEKHEEYDWITLITCFGYDELTDAYRWRTITRAVLVEVQ